MYISLAGANGANSKSSVLVGPGNSWQVFQFKKYFAKNK